MRRLIAGALCGFSITLNAILIAAYKSKRDECNKLIKESHELEKKLQNPFTVDFDDYKDRTYFYDVSNVLLNKKVKD